MSIHDSLNRFGGPWIPTALFQRVRYKVTVFPRSKKIKLPFLKVTVSESYRCPKVTVFSGIKLPFIVIKLPFLVIKLPFVSESYRFEFSQKINGNFDTDKVTVY